MPGPRAPPAARGRDARGRARGRAPSPRRARTTCRRPAGSRPARRAGARSPTRSRSSAAERRAGKRRAGPPARRRTGYGGGGRRPRRSPARSARAPTGVVSGSRRRAGDERGGRRSGRRRPSSARRSRPEGPGGRRRLCSDSVPGRATSTPATCHSFSPLTRAAAAVPGAVRRTAAIGAGAGRRVSMTRIATKFGPGRFGFTSTLTIRSSSWRVSITDGRRLRRRRELRPARRRAGGEQRGAAEREQQQDRLDGGRPAGASRSPGGQCGAPGDRPCAPAATQQPGLGEDHLPVGAREQRVHVHDVAPERQQAGRGETGDRGREHRREATQQPGSGAATDGDRRRDDGAGPEARAPEVHGDDQHRHGAERRRVRAERQSGGRGRRGGDGEPRASTGERQREPGCRPSSPGPRGRRRCAATTDSDPAVEAWSATSAAAAATAPPAARRSVRRSGGGAQCAQHQRARQEREQRQAGPPDCRLVGAGLRLGRRRCGAGGGVAAPVPNTTSPPTTCRSSADSDSPDQPVRAVGQLRHGRRSASPPAGAASATAGGRRSRTGRASTGSRPRAR